MTPFWILVTLGLYTLMLFVFGYFTSRKANNDSFYRANGQAPWYLVAYGMIGASLSGVTFISIPGAVGNSHFSYLMVVFGYLVGYAVIIKVLLPLYYKLQLTTIYSYLEQRFGFWSYKSGASYFLLSRLIGSSFRMFLVVMVLQNFVLDYYHIPFAFSAFGFVAIIIIYTFKGGIKTIVWTDTLQTTFMLASVVIAFILIAQGLGLNFMQLIDKVMDSSYSQVIITDVGSPWHFAKQFLSGMFITIVMTGLDQDMMQKNLSCRNLSDAQKNMKWLSISLLPINLIFLFLGASLYIFAAQKGLTLPAKPDMLFPMVAFEHLGTVSAVIFVIGIIAAAFSSADSAMTALTTSLSVDIIGIEKNHKLSLQQKIRQRKLLHLLVALATLGMIILFGSLNKDSVINELFKIAGFTYGPLLALFGFGLFSRRQIRDRWVPMVVIISPLLAFLIHEMAPAWGYTFGFEILLVNGFINFIGLYLISRRASA